MTMEITYRFPCTDEPLAVKKEKTKISTWHSLNGVPPLHSLHCVTYMEAKISGILIWAWRHRDPRVVLCKFAGVTVSFRLVVIIRSHLMQ